MTLKRVHFCHRVDFAVSFPQQINDIAKPARKYQYQFCQIVLLGIIMAYKFHITVFLVFIEHWHNAQNNFMSHCGILLCELHKNLSLLDLVAALDLLWMWLICGYICKESVVRKWSKIIKQSVIFDLQLFNLTYFAMTSLSW